MIRYTMSLTHWDIKMSVFHDAFHHYHIVHMMNGSSDMEHSRQEMRYLLLLYKQILHSISDEQKHILIYFTQKSGIIV